MANLHSYDHRNDNFGHKMFEKYLHDKDRMSNKFK